MARAKKFKIGDKVTINELFRIEEITERGNSSKSLYTLRSGGGTIIKVEADYFDLLKGSNA